MTASASRRRYRFDRFELLPAEGRLLDAGVAVALSGRARELLIALIESDGQLATKAALLQRVWPGLVVEENTLQVHVSALRKLLGANAIATVSGRGYRFALSVTTTEDDPREEVVVGNLPRIGTSFVGRARETREIKLLLERSRILTIVGAGGSGKTRLAIEVAAEQRSAMPDGVWFVELAALAQGALIPQRVGAAMGLSERPAVPFVDDLIHHLEARRALLIFDNVEHLLAPTAKLIDDLLTRCPSVSILVTSRERLGVPGELTYPVPALALPDGDASPERIATCESVVLFVDRARVLRPHFSVNLSNAAVLASICVRLDGIPLAIELAAPRLRTMPLEEILARLDRRFSLLSDASNTRLPRQRTLRSLIDWSYELLGPAEQAVFCRTSVFAGGWTLRAAEHVCAGDGVDPSDVLDILASLVDKNLLSTEERRGVARYRVLETIQQYGLERLGENRAELRHRKTLQLSHFVAFGKDAEPWLKGAERWGWFDQLEADQDNIRASLSWSLGEGSDPAAGMTLAGAIWRFWLARSHAREGREWLSTAMAAMPHGAPPEALASVLNGAGVMAYAQADLDSARVLLERSLAIQGTRDNKPEVAAVLNNLGAVAAASGNYQEAASFFERSLVLGEELGDESRVVAALHNLGDMAHELQRNDDAIRFFERCLPIHRRLGDRHGVASDLASIGLVLARGGNHVEARKRLLQAIRIFWSIGDRWRVGSTISELAWMTATRGPIDRASRFWGANQSLRASLGTPLTAIQQAQHAAEVAAARAEFANDSDFHRAWRLGTEMSYEETVRYAIEPSDDWPDDWRDACDDEFLPLQETSGFHQD